jgi:hypothetical protein
MTPPDIPPPPATGPLVAPFLPSLSPAVSTGPSPGLPLAAPSLAPIISPETTPGFLGAPTLSPTGTKPTAESTDASTPRLNSLGLRTAALADVPREIPEWKQRQNSKGRKFAKRSLQLAGVGVAEGEGFGSAASVTRLAISLPTFETALPIDILGFVILSESDDTGSGLFLIDDVALFEPIPQARIGRLTGSLAHWLDASIVPSPIVGFADEIPEEAGAGEILASIFGSPDGIGTRLTVSTPTAGATSTYFLVDASDSPRTILAPPVG